MTGFRPAQYHPVELGGLVIHPDNRAEGYDLERLERALDALLVRYRELQDRNCELGRALEEREGRVRSLDEQLLESNQRRQDAAKRLDDLLSQIDRIDAGLGAAPQPSRAAPREAAR